MTLSEIATVTGKGGLYKVLAPTKSGVILESMDEAKTKMVATTNHKLSLLHEISLYTTTKEGTVSLEKVLGKIREEYGDDTGVDANSDASELRAFLKSILPEYDEARVYTSDIRKLVKWYDIIRRYAPEIIEPKKDVESTPDDKEVSDNKETSDNKKKSGSGEKKSGKKPKKA